MQLSLHAYCLVVYYIILIIFKRFIYKRDTVYISYITKALYIHRKILMFLSIYSYIRMIYKDAY